MTDNIQEQSRRVRLDKWLWAARFYKTRVLSAEAIDAGKVEVNGERAKRARLVQEHMKSMQEGMKMMHASGGPMTGGRKDGLGAMSGDSRDRHEMMAQCMDMMQRRGPAAGEHGKQP